MDFNIHQIIRQDHGHLISTSKSPHQADIYGIGVPSVIGSYEESDIPSPPSLVNGPLGNFGEVVPGVYRSSFPRITNFDHLASLGLKSILTLVPEEYPSENIEFMEGRRIQHFQIPIIAHKSPLVAIPPQTMAAALRVIANPANHPILIHCNKGKHRTGCVVGCYRKLHGWEINDVLKEYRSYAGNKFRPLDEKFIEGFNHQTAMAMATIPTPPASASSRLDEEDEVGFVD